MMSTSRVIRTIGATVALLAMTTLVHAQYVWLDAKGVKQYSDMPPPASIPQKSILKSPGAVQAQPSALPAQTEIAEKGKAAPVAASVPMTTAEKNADFNKRRIAQAEKDKKASDQAKADVEKAKNCDRARDYKRALDSGERIGQTGSNGERVTMTDEQRALESKTVKSTLDACNA